MRCPVTSKVRHLDEQAALAAKARLPYGDRLEPYPCPDCEGWHLGGHHRRHKGDIYVEVASDSEVWAGRYPAAMGGTTIGDRLRGLGAELEELERTDPAVAEARRRLDELPEVFARYDRHMAARRAVGKRDA